ncbi:MAG: hypothetical protein ACQEWI_21910 [Bacillota bacterium]
MPQNIMVVVVNQGDEDVTIDLIDSYNQKTPNNVRLLPLLEDGSELRTKKGEILIEASAQSVEMYEVKGKLKAN